MVEVMIQIALLSFLLSPAMAFAGEPQTGFLRREVIVGHETYRYQVFVPRQWNGGKKWPVILFLHGAGERGRDGERQAGVGLGRADALNREDFPAVIVMPQCREKTAWRDPAMRAQALAALEQAIREFNGDRERVSLTGISMGGYGTWEFAADETGLFSAYVPVCGGLRASTHYPEIYFSRFEDLEFAADPYAALARRVGRIPVRIFHGGADLVVPVDESRKMATALKAAGADAQYVEYPGVGHDSWDAAYADPGLLSWMTSQKK